MRLWHQYMIPYLSDKHLLGQHRECCALRGNGWGRKHATVDYVFLYPKDCLYAYHMLIIQEMNKRHFNVSDEWRDKYYCGNGEYSEEHFNNNFKIQDPIYEEHNKKYLDECISNLKNKGYPIDEFEYLSQNYPEPSIDLSQFPQEIIDIILRSKISFNTDNYTSMCPCIFGNKDTENLNRKLNIPGIYDYTLNDFIKLDYFIALLVNSYEDYEALIKYADYDSSDINLKETYLQLIRYLLLQDIPSEYWQDSQSQLILNILYKTEEVDAIHFTLQTNETSIMNQGLWASTCGDFGAGIYFIDRFSDMGFYNVQDFLNSFIDTDEEVSGLIYYLQNDRTYKCDNEGGHQGYVVSFIPILNDIPEDIIRVKLKELPNLRLY